MKKTSKRTSGSHKPSQRQARSRPGGDRSYERALVAFADLAKRVGIRWYVFGAHAENVHGYPRATADLDLTIELAGRSVVAFFGVLNRSGFTPRFTDNAFAAATHVIPVVHRATELPIDLVLAGPGLEQLFLDEVHIEKIARRAIPFLSIENLIVTKLLAARPKDLEDVRELLARRGKTLDHARIEEVLAELQAALDQRDLLPQYRRLRVSSGRLARSRSRDRADRPG